MDIRAVESLISALKDEYDYVRQRASTALGKIGDIRAVESLINTLNDDDSSVQRGANQALKQITEKDFGEDSANWQEWWEGNKDKFKKSIKDE